MTGVPRWAILLLGVGLLVFGFAVVHGLAARSVPGAQPTISAPIDVSAEDAKLYRAVPFEWRVNSAAGSFKGNDTAHVRIDNSGERTIALRLAAARQRRHLDPRHALAERGATSSSATSR